MGGRYGYFPTPGARRLMPIGLMAAGLVVAAGLAVADPARPRLQWPVACTPGSDCWIFNYVDLDPGKGAKDFTCGAMTYDAHKGTDIAIRDRAAMIAGVPVLAAFGGTVVGVRDGTPDVNFRQLKPQAIAGRECGNGVRLRHAGGWTTQYCHLRQGSVKVGRGDRVDAGQILGLVGLSGKTVFPHLHLQVTRNKRIVDPFAGLGRKAACGQGPSPLWAKALLPRIAYRRSIIFNFGFHDSRAFRKAAQRGDYRAKILFAPIRKLNLWAEIIGVWPGDRLRFRLTVPDGRTVEKRGTLKLDRRKQALFRGIAFALKRGSWPKGSYRGRVILSRDGPDGTETYDSGLREVEIR